MRAFRGRLWSVGTLVAVAALFGALPPVLPADVAAGRQLGNAWELHYELKVARGTEAAVKDYFPSFLEYQDLVMFHPKVGYYASGRVSFTEDYWTFPVVLDPYFGQMIAEQAFRMWQGMRRAGTLGPDERFTIAEFGGGNGLLAGSILDYLERQAEKNPEAGWHDFASQSLYVCYDRSPALRRVQQTQNARFGKRFEAREADATNPAAAIAPGSLKGLILSNELPDAFSVHKVALSADGSPEVAFVVPWLVKVDWDDLSKRIPAEVAEAAIQGDRAIRSTFFAGEPGRTYLTRRSFVALLEALAASPDYASAVGRLHFHEVYVPSDAVPELREHLRRYARSYAVEMARDGEGLVTYVNLGVGKFIQGVGRILKAGYVITIDYGSNWAGIMAHHSYPHFRTYGPGHYQQDWETDQWDTSEPYNGPTLNDMTTDVNFSLMEAEGELAGLKTVYYGNQAALQTGTPVSLAVPPATQREGGPSPEHFAIWAGNFAADGNYKLMVQQKAGTDSSYAYPDKNAEHLASDEYSMTESQRQRTAQIEKRLSAAPEPALR